MARFEVPEGWCVQAFRFTLDPTEDQARAGAAFRRSPQGLQLGGRYFESRYRGVARYWYRDCQAVAAGAS